MLIHCIATSLSHSLFPPSLPPSLPHQGLKQLHEPRDLDVHVWPDVWLQGRLHERDTPLGESLPRRARDPGGRGGLGVVDLEGEREGEREGGREGERKGEGRKKAREGERRKGKKEGKGRRRRKTVHHDYD